jgi:hypothetical protein
MAGSASAMKNTMIPEILVDIPKTKPQTKSSSGPKPRKQLQFEKPELTYCEPTSSKVKTEDLIMAEQEQVQIDQQSSTSMSM